MKTRSSKKVIGLPPSAAFTIIELMVVLLTIFILAASILGVSGYVQEKGKRSRAEGEIAAMSAALENYKADNGIYPRDSSPSPSPSTTDGLNALASPVPSPDAYQAASYYLYRQLSGLDADQKTVPNMKSYFNFKPQMLGHIPPTSSAVAFIQDPFKNSYGYSTANQADSTKGVNPTYDLWSTAGAPSRADKWIKNW